MSNPNKLTLEKALETYGSTTNDFFSLKNDKDTAVVRFLYDGMDDLDWYVVHACLIGEKKRWVLCTQESDCPLCQKGNAPTVRLFLQVEDLRDGKVKTWERGKTFVSQITSLMNRYKPLYQTQIEVERNGKPKDPKTSYMLFPLEKEPNLKAADLPEKQVLVGENGFILQKNREDMLKIAEGTFVYERVESPPTANPNGPAAQPRRRAEGQEVF